MGMVVRDYTLGWYRWEIQAFRVILGYIASYRTT